MIWVFLIIYGPLVIPNGGFSTYEECDAARSVLEQQHPDIPAILTCKQMEAS